MARTIKELAPDLLFATRAEADAIGVPLENLAGVAVTKLGAAGCSVLGTVIPSPTVDEVDPTGAGDALAAAFCTWYLRGATPAEAAQRAVEVAAEAVTKVGARPA